MNAAPRGKMGRLPKAVQDQVPMASRKLVQPSAAGEPDLKTLRAFL